MPKKEPPVLSILLMLCCGVYLLFFMYECLKAISGIVDAHIWYVVSAIVCGVILWRLVIYYE
jgi:hypothetical protein